VSDRLPRPHASKHVIREVMSLQEGGEFVLSEVFEDTLIKMCIDKPIITKNAIFHKKNFPFCFHGDYDIHFDWL